MNNEECIQTDKISLYRDFCTNKCPRRNVFQTCLRNEDSKIAYFDKFLNTRLQKNAPTVKIQHYF